MHSRALIRLPKRSYGRRSLPYCASTFACFSSSVEEIEVQWKRKDGSVTSTPVRVGANYLRQAQRHEIELEGACEGVCACSTCHVIFEDDVYDTLPEPSEEEDDMLDQAFGLTTTSRLGCQVIVQKEHEGILITLPKATRNFYVDGHVPKPH